MFKNLHKKWKQAEKARCADSQKLKRRLITEGQEVFKKFNIRQVVLFGSVLENRATQGSDIDIFVDPLANVDFFTFQCLLEERLNVTIDLHTVNEDKVLVEKIIQRGEVIYEV